MSLWVFIGLLARQVSVLSIANNLNFLKKVVGDEGFEPSTRCLRVTRLLSDCKVVCH